MHKWEPVSQQGMYAMYRMAVPGGWLYRYGNSNDSSLVFVPTPGLSAYIPYADPNTCSGAPAHVN